jgi:hypothetical protein
MQGNLLVCLPFLLLGAVACGQGHSSSPGGELGEGLVVSPGVTVSTATYTIAGPNGFTSAGTVPVGDSPDVIVIISHLPVGQGYELRVSGTASDSKTVCDGSATFSVTNSDATLSLVVHLECAVPAGDLNLAATVNLCPAIDDLTAAPLNLTIGGVSHLSMLAHDSDAGPAALAYSWSANGVKLLNQTTTLLNFACSSLGEVTIAAAVSDGDTSCNDSSSVKVSCE